MNEKASAVSVPALLLTAAITITITVTLLFFSCDKKEKASGAIALTVNGKAITVAEVDETAEFFRRQPAFVSPDQVFDGGDGIRRAAARQLVANELLLAEAARLGWRADSARVNEAVERFIAQFPDREAFMSQLTAMGESLESMRKGMEDEFLLDSLLSTVSATAKEVSDEDCRKFYDANAERYKEPGMARASHIVFELEQTASDSQVREAMDRAKAAAAKAKGGADFNALIKEYSPISGGDIGWFKRGDLVPELERKIFSMKKGDISEPMPSSMGIHIMKKTDEKEPRQMDYKEAEAAIRMGFAEQRKAERVNAYVDSLIGTADIKYIDTTLVMRDTTQ